MTRSDLFDVTSIPGLDDLTRAGHVPADPTALASARAALDAAIAEETARDTSAPTQARGSARRWVLRGVAVAAAVALVPIGRIALDSAQPGLATVAMAADGSLECSKGSYATPMAPSDADLRLLPDTLPAGWSLSTIAARWEVSDDPAVCRVPALSLVRTDDRVVTGNVSVFGPFAGVDAGGFMGDRSTVQVAGSEGLLLDSGNDKFLRWVWTDAGSTWVMEAQGLSRKQGTALARSVTTEDDTADWEPGDDDLGLRVVAQRSGPAPTYRPAELSWYVDLAGPGGRFAHYTVSYQPDHPTPAAQAAGIGVRVSADGSELSYSRPASDQLVIWRDGLTISAGPGPTFAEAGTDPRTWDVPYATLQSIVEELEPAPANDPRLTQYAFDESTEPHP